MLLVLILSFLNYATTIQEWSYESHMNDALEDQADDYPFEPIPGAYSRWPALLNGFVRDITFGVAKREPKDSSYNFLWLKNITKNLYTKIYYILLGEPQKPKSSYERFIQALSLFFGFSSPVPAPSFWDRFRNTLTPHGHILIRFWIAAVLFIMSVVVMYKTYKTGLLLPQRVIDNTRFFLILSVINIIEHFIADPSDESSKTIAEVGGTLLDWQMENQAAMYLEIIKNADSPNCPVDARLTLMTIQAIVVQGSILHGPDIFKFSPSQRIAVLEADGRTYRFSAYSFLGLWKFQQTIKYCKKRLTSLAGSTSGKVFRDAEVDRLWPSSEVLIDTPDDECLPESRSTTMIPQKYITTPASLAIQAFPQSNSSACETSINTFKPNHESVAKQSSRLQDSSKNVISTLLKIDIDNSKGLNGIANAETASPSKHSKVTSLAENLGTGQKFQPTKDDFGAWSLLQLLNEKISELTDLSHSSLTPAAEENENNVEPDVGASGPSERKNPDIQFKPKLFTAASFDEPSQDYFWDYGELYEDIVNGDSERDSRVAARSKPREKRSAKNISTIPTSTNGAAAGRNNESNKTTSVVNPSRSPRMNRSPLTQHRINRPENRGEILNNLASSGDSSTGLNRSYHQALNHNHDYQERFRGTRLPVSTYRNTYLYQDRH